jgi:hypothetical protein
LDESGDFTPEGRMQYLDDIAGYVSYLNREKDARQFAQPIIEHIYTPIISNVKNVEKFDKKIMRELLETNVEDLKADIEKANKKLEGELGQVSNAKFAFLKDEVCGDLTGKSKSECTKVVNENIRQLVKEAKEYAAEIRNKIKDMNNIIKERKKLKGTAIKDIGQNIKKYQGEYEKYKTSLLYELKDKCSKKVVSGEKLKEELNEHPVIKQYNESIEKYNKEIDDLDNDIKMMKENYKIRMKHLRELLKSELTDTERNVVNMIVRDERKTYTKNLRNKQRSTQKASKVIKEDLKKIEREKAKRRSQVTKKIRGIITDEKRRVREFKRETNKIRKTIHSEKRIMKHDILKELVNKYRSKIMEDLVDVDNDKLESNKDKVQQKENKKMEAKKIRETRKLERDNEKAEKKKQKEMEKQRARETKRLEKEEEKRKKQAEKEANKGARKTRKNKSP